MQSPQLAGKNQGHAKALTVEVGIRQFLILVIAMSKLQRLQPSRSLLNAAISAAPLSRPISLSICRQCLRTTMPNGGRHPPQFLLSRRAASSTSSSSGGSKPIVLEQPDKFRPPSHPARLNRARRPTGGAYNQGPTEQEREKQKTRTYPHMFPNQGTFLHWFLTDRWIHLWITMVSVVQGNVETFD